MREITCPLIEATQRWPEQPALIDNNTIVTYRELSRRVDGVVLNLQGEGVGEGALVGILAENSLSYLVLLYALWRLGAVACPVGTRIPVTTVAQMLDRVGCRLLVATRDRLGDECLKSVRQFDMDRLTASEASELRHEQRSFMVDLDRAATVVFTSGTTTEPKAILHPFGAHYYSALGSNENITVAPGDRWLLCLPLYHVGGLAILFRVLLGGGTIVVSPSDIPLNRAIEHFQITQVSLVAAQLRRLLQSGVSPSAAEWLKAILVGGQAVPRKQIADVVQRGWPIFTTYGLTEMASQVTTTAPHDSPAHLETSGKLLPYRELEIAGDGEILVRGETLFQRYFGADDSRQRLGANGWFHTGDIGSLDDDGYLSVIGRKDNMFVSGGENIHPEEIEHCLNAVSEIEESLVVGQIDEEFGRRPVAFLKFARGETLDRETIQTSLKRHLPGFKLPVRFLQWPQSDGSEGLKPSRSRFVKLVQESVFTEIN